MVLDMLDRTCNTQCSDGRSLPRREGSTIFASCQCGDIIAWDSTKTLAENGQCSCGLDVAEGIIAGPHWPTIYRELAPPAKPTDDSANVVYFARTWDGLIKIGTTNDVWRRVTALQAELLGVIPGGYDVERATLHRFAEHVERGREWFRPHADLLAYIDEHTTLPDKPTVNGPVDGWRLFQKTREDIS